MENAVLIAQGKSPEDSHIRFWRIGESVYRTAGKKVEPDVDGLPMGRRWECSVSHFDRFFDSTYGKWVKRVREGDEMGDRPGPG